MRRDKVNYYLDLAEIVSQRGTCLRRRYGAVIVKNDEVVSTGYVGSPRGRKNCTDFVSDRNFRFQGVSAMNCAEAFTLRQMP